MFTLFRRIGCAIVLLVLGAAAWEFRDHWLPRVRAMIGAEAPDPGVEGWALVTDAGAARASAKIRSLGGTRGPGVVTIPAADFAAYVLGSALVRLADADSAPQAMLRDNKLFLRTSIRLGDLGGKESLGPLARMFNETEPLTLAGRIEPVRAGLAQFRLTEVSLRDLVIPKAAVTRLVRRWGPTSRPDSLDVAALPIVLPSYVAEVRVSKDRISLYRAAK
jgi:hypothetical protein